MNIHQDPRITRLIRPGEVHRRRRGRPTAPRNTQLVARHVMLRAARAPTGMQRNNLGAEEVVARGDGRRDRDVHLAAARVEVFDAPKVVVADLAGWVLGPGRREDFEPPRGAVGRGGVGDFGEVDLEGAVVRTADGFRGAGAVAGLLWGTESGSGGWGYGGRGGTWCISTVTVEPAFTGHLPLALPALALQRIWVEATSVMGELDKTVRAHWPPKSTPSTQSCWKVAWAAACCAVRAAARAATLRDFILAVSWVEGCGWG